MSKPQYSRVHKFLHWLSAAVIIWALTSGFYVSLFNVSATLKEWVSFINISLTTVYLPFFIARLYATQAYYRQMKGLHRKFADYLASSIHMLIHFTTATVMLTGFLMMDQAINVFGLFQVPHPLKDRVLITQFFTLHIWACGLLALLVLLHITAVIKHEMCGKPVLERMRFR